MTRKLKTLLALGVVLALLGVAAVVSLADTTYGTRDDPLVTLSYLDETVTPAIMDKLSGLVEEKAAALTSSFREEAASGAGSQDVQDGLRFAVVTMQEGQTLTAQPGAEIMLRLGAAASYGPDSPRLVDETEGTDVAEAGVSLTKNHMYMVTIRGCGVRASAKNTKLLVRGEYAVG